MGFKKFASFQVISKVLVPEDATAAQLSRVAHRVTFDYEPRPGYLYVRSRAISSRCNDNFDEFPAEEIKKAYATFKGKPVFVNHHNENHRRARGVIIDAALHEDRNPDGTPDTWAEVLMEVDAKRFPKLAEAILKGHIDRTSMGTDVAFSICSACNNKASTPSEYCFMPGTLITMADGTLRPIETIRRGDRVLTHDGPSTVVEPMERHYNGPMSRIFRNSYSAPLYLTHGHQVMANLRGRRDERATSLNCYSSVHASDNWDWTDSEKIDTGNWVQGAYPTEVSVMTTSVVDLAPDFVEREGRVFLGSVYSKGPHVGLTQYGKNSMPLTVDNDDEAFGFVVGLFAAEGSFETARTSSGTTKTVQWSLGAHEEALVHDLTLALDKLGAGSPLVYAREGTGGIAVRLSNAPLASLLRAWTGSGAKTKHLSGEVMLATPRFQRAFLDGYYRGDGWDDPNGHVEVRTVGGLLARQLVMLGARMEPTIPTWWENRHNPGGPSNRQALGTVHHLGMGRRGAMMGRRRLQDGYFANRVSRVEHDYYHGPVYNFEVEGQNSYVAEGAVVHNCEHIPRMKGKRIYRTTASGAKEGILIREKCYGLGFFENSLLVEEPADPTAYVVSVVSGDDWGMKTASTKQAALVEVAREAASTPAFTEHRLGCPTCQFGKRKNFDCPDCGNMLWPKDNEPDWSKPKDQWGVPRKQSKQAALKPASADDIVDFFRLAHGDHSTPMQRGSALEVEEPLDFFRARMALLFEAKPKTPIKDMTPEELAEHRAKEADADKWIAKNPPKAKHIVDHWNKATDEEKHSGMNWYEDAHHLAKHIANDTGTDHATMAGLLSNYSPQTHWAHNMMTAARVARTKTPLGGPGEGVMASSKQKAAAGRIVGGEHYDSVLKEPKTNAFAHLIEHGGNADPKNPRVVIDRHAMSVACGSRAGDMEYSRSGLSGKAKYKQFADAYHQAAKHISKQEQTVVHPHQVQAATWLARQRMNEDDDRSLSKTAGSRSASIAKRAMAEWSRYAGEHHPMLMGKEPGTGYARKELPKDAPEDVQHATDIARENEEKKVATKQAGIGDTLAPADVDTLRDEECPVCGESDSYDGNECQVCGFDAPPVMFRDPDLDKAKQLDLRKDILSDAGVLPGQDGLTPNQQDANGGMPGEVPGSGVPGTDQVVDPNDPAVVDVDVVGLDGQVEPAPIDPAQLAQQQMEQLQSGYPLTPDQLGPNGELIPTDVDPDAADMHVNQGGEAFTPGPNAPGEPDQPEGPGSPVSPEELDEDGEPLDGQQAVPQPGEGDPGTPEDGTPDLQCPVCGYAADAAQPMSTDMDSQATPDLSAPAGAMAGDVCPACGKGQMISVGEMEQMQGAPV